MSSAQPTFTAPSSATLAFELTVDDDGAGPHTHTDTVVITVDQVPTADAGPDQKVDVGDAVTLDGSGSSDPDAGDSLDYSWVQTAGADVTLTGATTASPTFSAPSSVTLTFVLTVTDENSLTDTDTVVITVNDPPVADAGADMTVVRKTTFTLRGTGNDVDGDPVTYAWTQVSGPAAVIRDPDQAETIVEGLPRKTTLVFRLTVTDSSGVTHTDDVTVTVKSK
jgi:hypothetical protein